MVFKMSIVSVRIPINEIDKYFHNRSEDIKRIKYHLNFLKIGISQSMLIRRVRGVGKPDMLKIFGTFPLCVCNIMIQYCFLFLPSNLIRNINYRVVYDIVAIRENMQIKGKIIL